MHASSLLLMMVFVQNVQFGGFCMVCSSPRSVDYKSLKACVKTHCLRATRHFTKVSLTGMMVQPLRSGLHGAPREAVVG